MKFFATSAPTSPKAGSGETLARGCSSSSSINAEQILNRKGKKPKPEPDDKILLRLFFHPHGDKLLLLLCGYDKLGHPSKTYQQTEIAEARALLKHWKEREKAKKAKAKKTGKK